MRPPNWPPAATPTRTTWCNVWRIATGAPLGPFQIYDIIGLTTHCNILSHGKEHTKALAAWLKANYIDQGKLGVASGEGFYVYEPPVA